MRCAETLFSACQLSVEGWRHNDQQLPPSKKSKKRSSRALLKQYYNAYHL